MPKGEVPGPYWNSMHTIYRGRLDTISSSHEVAEVVPEADLGEVDEYVDLLNKGTHYDRMLKALKEVEEYGVYHPHDPEGASAAQKMVRDAIAEADPTAKR